MNNDNVVEKKQLFLINFFKKWAIDIRFKSWLQSVEKNEFHFFAPYIKLKGIAGVV